LLPLLLLRRHRSRALLPIHYPPTPHCSFVVVFLRLRFRLLLLLLLLRLVLERG
jgi:hypothetical protein